MMTIGVYCIENTITGMKYIGKSVNVESRLNFHRNKLTKKVRDSKSTNEFLYSDVQTHGWCKFKTYVKILSGNGKTYIQCATDTKKEYMDSNGRRC